jgi:hypothetical protein
MSDEQKLYYSERSRRCAEQTRKRARRKQRQKERERLTRLGADPTWLERVLPSD